MLVWRCANFKGGCSNTGYPCRQKQRKVPSLEKQDCETDYVKGGITSMFGLR